MTTVALLGLNSLSFAMLLFVLGAGLTITFGLMRILNMTHGSFFLLGAYFGLAAWKLTHNFWVALLAGALATAVAGMVLYRVFLRRFSQLEEMAQVLLTFGALLVIADGALITWGGNVETQPPASFLRGSVHLGALTYPKYRFFLIGAGLAIAVTLWLFVARTRLGAMVRAGVDDPEMAKGLGINMPLLFLAVFALGSLLAGLAGALGAPYLGIYPGLDFEALVLAFIVVIVGGVGSIEGAFVGALLVASVDTATKTYFPNLAWFSLYAPMAIILAFRPQGLLGRK
ncbi:MAG: branched-chain amino acid ABC transporter permease [Chloroflexi bacterium]|nr:branched-chain amino acid ABC transporter permease [Chloroflexota bacterium]